MPDTPPAAMAALPSIRRRLVAMFYESLLVAGVLMAGFLMPQVVLGMAFHVALPGSVLFLHIFAILGAYFFWNWRRGGQTLAMRTWKLRLRSADGGELRPGQLVLRYAAAWPSILFAGIGILWALADKDRQFLHDRIAGTRIVVA